MIAYPYTAPVLVAHTIQRLTAHPLAFTLSATGNKPVRAWKPVFRTGEKSPQPIVAFLCASYCAALCRLSIMTGCFWEAFAACRTCSRYFHPKIQPVAHAVESMNGGYSLLKNRITRMNTQSSHAQNPANPSRNAKTNPMPRRSLADILKEQARQRGLEPLPLEAELLLKRITDGGHSGQFLADAFISAYRTGVPFPHSLGELHKLDAEAFRLFHEILHIRHISGWNDDDLYQLEQRIMAIVGGA